MQTKNYDEHICITVMQEVNSLLLLSAVAKLSSRIKGVMQTVHPGKGDRNHRFNHG